jgi:hypothetical protein
VALEIQDYILRRPEHLKIPTKLEEIKTNFLNTVLFKTEGIKSSAQ